jgi:hypothetical protein
MVAYLGEQGIALRRSRISASFLREGLKGQHEGGSWNEPRVW